MTTNEATFHRPLHAEGIIIRDVTAQAVTIEIAENSEQIRWSDLWRFARPPGKNHELYRRIIALAERQWRSEPIAEQGITIIVLTRTGGATWECVATDATVAGRRDVMRADEGGSHPHRHLAVSEARDIAARTGGRIEVRPFA